MMQWYSVLITIAIVGAILYYVTYMNNNNSNSNKAALGGTSEAAEYHDASLHPACGMNGDVSMCAGPPMPTALGENNSIYALGEGSIHDPRLERRNCTYKPRLLCPDTSCDLMRRIMTETNNG